MPEIAADIVVIGLGNPLLHDDAAGLTVVGEAERRLGRFGERVDYRYSYSGGMDLLDVLVDRRRALLVDCMVSGAPAGTTRFFPLEDIAALTQDRIVDSHGLNLPTVIEAGRRCGFAMPETVQVLAIEADDVTTFDDRLSPAVAAAVEGAVAAIDRVLTAWTDSKGALGDG